MYKPISLLILILSSIILAACVPDAAHDNPADPYLSKSNSGITFSGTVYSMYQPYKILENVKVSLENIGRFVYTNSFGQFEIEGLQEQSYQLILFKEGYLSDTVMVEISAQNVQNDFHLNALPQLTSIQYYSTKRSTIFSTQPNISVGIEIEVNDPDGPGDIDSAQVRIDTFNFKSAFEAILPPGNFQLTIQEQDLEGYNIHDLVEKPLWIRLMDKAQGVNKAGPFYNSRFIEQIAQPVAPDNLETAIQPLFFVWEELALPYQFTFELNIYRRESGISQLIHTQHDINSTATDYTYNTILDNGTYYWTIKIVDSKMNSSESKEAVFQIR